MRKKTLYGVIALVFVLTANAGSKVDPKVEAVPDPAVDKKEVRPVKVKDVSKDIDTTDFSLIKGEKDCHMVNGKLECKVKSKKEESPHH